MTRLGRWVLAGLIALVAACSSPSLRFQGTESVQTLVNGRRIDVYSIPGPAPLTREAQAIILDGVLGVPEPALREDAAQAMARALPGCRLDPRTLEGSSTAWTARLACPGGPARAPP